MNSFAEIFKSYQLEISHELLDKAEVITLKIKAKSKALGKDFCIAPSHVELTKGEKSKVEYFTLNFSFSQKDLLDFKEKITKALEL